MDWHCLDILHRLRHPQQQQPPPPTTLLPLPLDRHLWGNYCRHYHYYRRGWDLIRHPLTLEYRILDLLPPHHLLLVLLRTTTTTLLLTEKTNIYVPLVQSRPLTHWNPSRIWIKMHIWMKAPYRFYWNVVASLQTNLIILVGQWTMIQQQAARVITRKMSMS